MEEVNYIPGDLVEFCNRIQRIENIDKQTSYRVSIRLEHGWFVDKPEEILKFLKPIPLTPAILEANGWLFLNDGYIKCYQHPKDWRLQVQIIKGKYLTYLHDEVLYEINQVHQLQHLLFGLGLNSELKV